MFDTYLSAAVKRIDQTAQYNPNTSAVVWAHNLFDKVYHKAALRRVFLRLLGRPNDLLDLHSVLAQGAGEQQYRGARTVPIQQIVGSESRSADFDRSFMPINRSSRERWKNIAAIMLRGEHLPAVELVQVGEQYFVRDGHHRVSVARVLGQIDIDAVVTGWVPATAAQPVPCCRRSRFAPMVGLP